MSSPTASAPAMIPIPLPEKAHHYARQFARQQTTNELAKQVYLQALAVYAVNTYLRCLGIETDLEASDIWNGLYGNLSDSANLELPGIGQVECCPVHPGADSFVPPQMGGSDRIAYIAVQFKDVLDEVDLIGYRPILDASHPPDEIFVDDFDDDSGSYDGGYSVFPIENLLIFLYSIRHVRQGMEDADDPLLVGIREQLEAQLRSTSEFAVRAVSKARDRNPDLDASNGEDLLAPYFNQERREQMAGVDSLMDSLKDEEDYKTTERPENEEFRKTGAQFIQWVRGVLGIESSL